MAKPPAVRPGIEPSPAEAQHIEQALASSQTAMDAIGTVTDIATYTLTILGVFIGILALWGVGALVKAARGAAKQIANARWNDYIASEEFNALVNSRIDEAVRAQRLDTISRKLEELARDETRDAPPFEEKEG
jgi:uncharacterized membrane protein YhiD involved in acid resistance